MEPPSRGVDGAVKAICRDLSEIYRQLAEKCRKAEPAGEIIALKYRKIGRFCRLLSEGYREILLKSREPDEECRLFRFGSRELVLKCLVELDAPRAPSPLFFSS